MVHKGSVTLSKAQRVAVAVVRLERELYPLSLAMTIGERCVLTMVLKVLWWECGMEVWFCSGCRALV